LTLSGRQRVPGVAAISLPVLVGLLSIRAIPVLIPVVTLTQGWGWIMAMDVHPMIAQQGLKKFAAKDRVGVGA